MRLPLFLAAAAALSACGPPPPMTQARAERLCQEEVRAADGVTGRVGVGVGSDGALAQGRLTVTDRVSDPIPSDRALRGCVARVLAGGDPDPTAGARFTLSIEGET